jgi:hypothetical protein
MGGGCVAGGMQIPKCGTTGKCKTGSIDSTGPKLGPTRIIRYHNLDLTILNISSKCLNNPHQKRGGFGRPGPSIGPTRKLLGPIQIICRCAAAFCLLPLGVLDLFTPYHSSFPPGPLGLASHGVRVAIRSQGPGPGQVRLGIIRVAGGLGRPHRSGPVQYRSNSNFQSEVRSAGGSSSSR